MIKPASLVLFLKFIPVLCLICLDPAFVRAQEPVQIDVKFDYPSTKQQRTLLAKSLLSYFEGINAKIPNLKPTEVEWLSEEQKRIRQISSTVERIEQNLNFRKSREYTIWLVKNELKELESKIRALSTESYLQRSLTNRIPGQKENVINWKEDYSLQKELIEWLRVQDAILLSNHYDTIIEARLRGISMPYIELSINGISSTLGGSPKTIIAITISGVVGDGILSIKTSTEGGTSATPKSKQER